MKIFTKILGNINSPEWRDHTADGEIVWLDLDQWSAQKSRFVIMRPDGDNYAVALGRNHTIADGDILDHDPESHRTVAVRLQLADVMVADLSALSAKPTAEIVRRAVELGHAIGNQHWPAVVKGMEVYIPMTVDRKVMESVMATLRFEGVACSFRRGREVIPYLAPHEVRRLFGGAEQHPHHHEA